MQRQGNAQILYRVTYIYLALPLFLFLLTWLNFGFAALFGLVLGLAFYKMLQTNTEQTADFHLSRKMLISAGGLAFIWCFFAGIGYFYYQSFDYHFRNAVFRDLINYEWPVMYDKANTPLVYYMGFWLFPALITKVIALFSVSLNTLFFIGNIFLFIYAVLGATLIFLHIGLIVQAKNVKQFLIAILIFMLFSGLDIIGYLFFQGGGQPFSYHLDWWAAYIQYSSLTTDMFWVFNQFIPAALAVMLIYNERAIKNFGFLVPFILFLAPYPALGICFLMFAFILEAFYNTEQKKEFITTEIFSIQNLIGVFWLLIPVILYFKTNSGGIDRFSFFTDFISFKQLFIFIVLEFLLYVAVLFPYYKKSIIFNLCLASLFIFPLIRIDQQNNLCMRTSMPILIMLSLFVLIFLFESFRENKNKFLREVLMILLLLGAATPLMEFYRGFHYVAEARRLQLVKDELYTLNQAYARMPEFGYDVNHQFSAKNYKTDIFWQYLAKKH